MLSAQYDLKQLINEKGEIISSPEEILKQEQLALQVMEYFLGCSIVVNGSRFILSNLELYYGGIGDMAHDWYRSSFPERYEKKSRHSKNNTIAQISKGPIFYFNQKGNGKFKRCDIVVGHEGVAISFLIRNVLDKDLVPLGAQIGQTNIVLKKMGLTDDYHMKPLEIIDTRSEVFEKGFEIERKMRVIGGKATGFDYNCVHDKKDWNLMLKIK